MIVKDCGTATLAIRSREDLYDAAVSDGAGVLTGSFNSLAGAWSTGRGGGCGGGVATTTLATAGSGCGVGATIVGVLEIRVARWVFTTLEFSTGKALMVSLAGSAGLTGFASVSLFTSGSELASA